MTPELEKFVDIAKEFNFMDIKNYMISHDYKKEKEEGGHQYEIDDIYSRSRYINDVVFEKESYAAVYNLRNKAETECDFQAYNKSKDDGFCLSVVANKDRIRINHIGKIVFDTYLPYSELKTFDIRKCALDFFRAFLEEHLKTLTD